MSAREVPSAAAPHVLVGAIEAPGVHALDACGPEGWGTRPGGGGPGLSLLGCAPEVVFRGDIGALGEARRWLREHRSPRPLDAILMGFLSYDLGRSFERIGERIAPEPLDAFHPVPDVYLAGFRAVYAHASGQGWVTGGDARAVRRLAARIDAAAACRPAPIKVDLPPPRFRTGPRAFRQGVRRILEWVRAGDVYQVNLSRRLELERIPRALLPQLYAALTARAGAPFSAYLDAGDPVVLSNSPERFLRVHDARVETCPIKGTRPRGRTPAEDARLARELARSEKDLAEHRMIVDLERSDLGRVSRIGSVRVARLHALRSFANVHHLVSSVQGELEDPGDWGRLLAATFPGGSITGAPKIRAMQIIEELEPVRRGVYTGALGYLDAAGGLDLAVAIRTAVARGDALHLSLGGGIVADSDPHAELQETREKGRAWSSLWSAED